MTLTINQRKELLIKLGNRIKDLRNKKGITQSQLAQSCNMEKSFLSKIESGKLNISYSIMYRISKSLNVSMIAVTEYL